jgi:dipeptide/tripeptide permease
VVLLTLSSWLPGLQPNVGQDASPLQLAALFGALGVIALGTGGIKPNVSAFGADQFDETDPQDKAEKASFFNWFYLAINLGSLISCTVVVYIQVSAQHLLPCFYQLPAGVVGLQLVGSLFMLQSAAL